VADDELMITTHKPCASSTSSQKTSALLVQNVVEAPLMREKNMQVQTAGVTAAHRQVAGEEAAVQQRAGFRRLNFTV
jgi:hypothetical protein